MRNVTQARPSLPRIVRFLGTDDSPGAACPHCGAEGRWVHRFEVEGGRTLGAMSGCVKLFPIAPVALVALELDARVRDYHKRGWQISGWLAQALNEVDAYYRGERTEDSVCREVRALRRMAAERAKVRRR